MICTKSSMIRCVRCKGRKKIFKMNGGYTYVNMGGVQVDCPMCLGTGQTKSITEVLEELQKSTPKNKADKTKEKDFKDGEKPENIPSTQE
jgi:phage FluMu protein Com